MKKEKGLSSFGKNNERLIVGYDSMDYNPVKKFAEYKNTERFDKLVAVDTYLQKDSEGIVCKNKNFYNKIENSTINNIYSFGFSYSRVDEPQIREVCRALNRKKNRTREMTWYLNKYDEQGNKNESYKKIIRKLGFEGEFAVYDADSI